MRFARLIPIVFALLAAAVPARGQDAEGSKDHPMFSRMPGYTIGEYDAQDFGAFDYWLNANADPIKKVEGKYWKLRYQLPEGAKKAGPIQIGRNYTDLIIKRGGKKAYEALNSEGGTTVATLPVGGGRTLWLSVEVHNSGEVYELYIVEEADMKQDVEFTAGELAEALKTKGSTPAKRIIYAYL